MGLKLCSWIDRNFFSIFIFSFEFYKAINQCKYSMVFTHTYIIAWVSSSTSLANNNISSSYELTAKFFNT